MPIGVYERPTYNVVCSVCGCSYEQKRKPIENPKCVKCRKKESNSKYHETHKDEQREYQQREEVKARKRLSDKKYYEKNKEVVLKKQHEYYMKNKERILKYAESYRRERGEKPNGLSGTESLVKDVLLEVFQNTTIVYKDRKTILNPITNHYLELDFYFPELGVAIEIQGPTHYAKIYGEEKYKRQLRNDQIKRDECERLGITLIEIVLEEGVHYDRYDTEHRKLRETILAYLDKHFS